MTILQPHKEGVPVPEASLMSQPFWDGAARGELWFQRCGNCARAIFNPAWACRFCASRDLRWERSIGTGSIYTYTIIWRAQTPAFDPPYVAGVVDVDEGFQMIANIIGCQPEEVAVGMRVAAEFHPIGEGVSLPYFRPI